MRYAKIGMEERLEVSSHWWRSFSHIFWLENDSPGFQRIRAIIRTTFQAQNTTAQDAYTAVNLAKTFYDRQREPFAFEAFYQQEVKNAEGKTEPPTLSRYRKAPKRTDDISWGPTHRFDSPGDLFRQQYFEVMENLSGELTRRFEQNGLHLISLIGSLLIGFSSGKAQEIPAEVLDMYSKDGKGQQHPHAIRIA